MAAVNPYLNFNGNTEDAFNFYKSVFGGEFDTIMRYKDMPSNPQHKVADSEAQKIIHVSLPLDDGTLLMGSDVPEHFGKVTIGTNFHISITAKSKEEADKLFNGLSAGGKVTMPMDNTFWGAYFGMVTDKFSVQWMISYGHKQ